MRMNLSCDFVSTATVVSNLSSESGWRSSKEGHGETIVQPSGMNGESGDCTFSLVNIEIARDQQICEVCLVNQCAPFTKTRMRLTPRKGSARRKSLVSSGSAMVIISAKVSLHLLWNSDDDDAVDMGLRAKR